MKLCVACRQPHQDADWRCPQCGHQPATRQGVRTFGSWETPEDQGFEAGFFANLARLEENSFWFKARNRLLIWLFGRHLPHAKNFLEIGAGTGYVLAGLSGAFPSVALHGSELFLEGLLFVRQRLPESTQLYQMDARQIPFVEEFDSIGAFDVLEHISEDEAVMAEMFTALRPGGKVFVTVPQHPFLWSAVDEFSHHKRRYTRPELLDKLRRAGFVLDYVSSFVSLIFPVLLLSRWLRRKQTAQSYDPSTEYQLPQALSVLFELLMWLEFGLLRLGLRFPFGGSLVAVASKPAK